MFADGAKLLMVQTGQGGEAVAVGLRPNQIPGVFKVNITASYQGQTAAAAITQTNALAGAVAGAAAGGAAGVAAGAGISAATVAIVVGVAAAVAVGVGVGLSKGSDPAPQVAPTASTIRFGVGSGPIQIGPPP